MVQITLICFFLIYVYFVIILTYKASHTHTEGTLDRGNISFPRMGIEPATVAFTITLWSLCVKNMHTFLFLHVVCVIYNANKVFRCDIDNVSIWILTVLYKMFDISFSFTLYTSYSRVGREREPVWGSKRVRDRIHNQSVHSSILSYCVTTITNQELCTYLGVFMRIV